MKRTFVFCLAVLLLSPLYVFAQDYNSMDEEGRIRTAEENKDKNKKGDGKKEIPRGMRVWTVDRLFGDITPAVPDTLPYMYMNTIFTTGMHGEYNTTGNLGAARINRIFTDRETYGDFIFTQPYSYFITQPDQFHFTNTYSPITNLNFNTCGNRTNGEDHLQAIYAVNAGKRIGLGMKFNYLYGRGYYQNNSSALFNYTLYGSYLGHRYQAHLLMSTNHQKQAENGGITNDDYISHPEFFNNDYGENEIPTMLEENWNRNDNQHVFFTHRYSFGFNRQVPMTEDEIKAKKFAIESEKDNKAKKEKEEARKKAMKAEEEFDEEEYDRQAALSKEVSDNAPQTVEPNDTVWMKDEYVPVTSLIHTVEFDNYEHIYQAYSNPKDYYLATYPTFSKYVGDSIYDETKHYELRNTFAIALLEGFNKYAKAGLKAFITHDLKRFTLPDTVSNRSVYNQQNLIVGGHISKTQGKTLHYHALGKFTVLGENVGDVQVDGGVDVSFPLLGDTVQLAANGFFHLTDPTFYYTHYHSKHFWWDNSDLKKTSHTRLQGIFTFRRTETRLRVAVDNLTNYAYFSTDYTQFIQDDNNMRLFNTARPRQSGENIDILTVSLSHHFQWRLFHLGAELTYQKSTHDGIIPVPTFNAYTNLFLRFKIAHVLDCDLGADIRFFTKYKAPDFVPGISQYAIPDNADNRVEVGNYPIINAYANFFLKHARFFVMMSHVNHSSAGNNYFLTPHYPINSRIFRFGVSWNFFN